MKSSASYLAGDEAKVHTLSRKPRRRKPFALFATVAVLAAAVVASALSLAVIGGKTQTTKAAAWDPVQWSMCYFGEDSFPASVYSFTQTTDLQFELFSKSVVTNGKTDVDSGLNGILALLGQDFVKTNETVLGTKLPGFGKLSNEAEKDKPAKDTTSEKLFNKGAKVSPYDRFGFAGLTFTSYNGEWKHVDVNACSDQDPVDRYPAMFYEDRKDPKSVWEDITTSDDPRTIQFARGFPGQLWSAFVTVSSNSIFWVTKLLVALTVAFVNFSFTDMSELLGIDKMLSGPGGLFQALFKTAFFPLIVLAFAVTGLKLVLSMFSSGKIRAQLIQTGVALLLFAGAVLVSLKPALITTFPNKAVVAIQAVIVNAFAGGIAGGDGMCATDIGTEKVQLVNKSFKDDAKKIDAVGKNMRSAVGCMFWNNFAFKPWVEGQFGSEWNELWAKGKTPKWAPSGSKTVGNVNSEMVGNAAVPLGGGSYIYSWPVFQISTLTNAHSPIGHNGSLSAYTNGVANDWWRIADAFSNYDEKETSTRPPGMEDTDKVTYTVPAGNDPLPQWDTWAGNNPGNRFAAATSSLFIGALGIAAPMVFGFLSAMYSIGMSIVILFAPVMFLIGAWGQKGLKIFAQWGMLLWNLFMKRIATTIILMFSIVLVASVIALMSSVGWWSGAFMLVLVTVILISTRQRIIDALSASSGGGFAMTAQRMVKKGSETGKTIGRFASSSAIGAVRSKTSGGTFADGLKAGVKHEARNLSYRSANLRNVAIAHDLYASQIGKNDLNEATAACGICRQSVLLDGMVVNRGPDGTYYCQSCTEDGYAPEGTQEITMMTKKRAAGGDLRAEPVTAEERIHMAKVAKSTRVDAAAAEHALRDESASWDDRTEVFMKQLMNPTLAQVQARKMGLTEITVDVPAELAERIDRGTLSNAIKDGEWDLVESMFAKGWIDHMQDQVGVKFVGLMERVQADMKDWQPGLGGGTASRNLLE